MKHLFQRKLREKGVVHIDLPKCILSNKMNEFEVNKTIYNKNSNNINIKKIDEINLKLISLKNQYYMLDQVVIIIQKN